MEDYFLVVDSARVPVTLGQRGRGGGEADIRPVPDLRGCVAKIYHVVNGSSHASRPKLEAMLAKKPEHMTSRAGGVDLPQFAWPTHIIEDRAGAFRGFLMPEVPREKSELLSVYMSRTQMRQALSTDDCSLPRRVLVCANLASAITEMHRSQHYFVDIKPANISMYKDTGVLCLLDNDSFSIEGDGVRFPATAFTSEYLAPELMLNELSASAVITDWQDRFALAVLIFQVLNYGLHPFQGVPQFETEEWNIDMCVKQGFYPYALTSHPLVIPPPASIHSTWPTPLREMFDRAFIGKQGSKRPSAKEWRNHLQAYLGTFERCNVCPNDSLHIHFAGMLCQECTFDGLVTQRLERQGQRGQRAAESAASTRASTPPTVTPARDPSPNSQPSIVIARTAGRRHIDADPAVTTGPGNISAQPAPRPPTAIQPSNRKKAAYGLVLLAGIVGAGLILVKQFNMLRSDSASVSSSPYTPAPSSPPVAPPPATAPPPAVVSPPAVAPAPAPPAVPPAAPPAATVPINDKTLAMARNVSGPNDTSAINARIEIIGQAIRIAYRQNYSEMLAIINLGIAGDDANTLSSARTLMRNSDFTNAYADWNYTRSLGRSLNEEVLSTYRNDLRGAIAKQSKAVALAPLDREVAANLAYYLALDRHQAVMAATLYSLSLPRPADATGTASAWQTAAVAFARAGKIKESEGAFYVGLAITTKLSAFCKNLLTHQKDFGPELKPPITAVFKRIQDRGQSDQAFCAYPPQWVQ